MINNFKYAEGDVVECISNQYNEPDFTVGAWYTVLGAELVNGDVVYALRGLEDAVIHSMDKFKLVASFVDCGDEDEEEDIFEDLFPEDDDLDIYSDDPYILMKFVKESLTYNEYKGYLKGMLHRILICARDTDYSAEDILNNFTVHLDELEEICEDK